jgi:hypothetical protein
MESTATGRSFGVASDGTLHSVARHFDTDITSSGGYGKPPMKVIMSKATAESLKHQLKPPTARVYNRNVNDSVNLNDFLEYGAMSGGQGKSRTDRLHDCRTYDVRKW